MTCGHDVGEAEEGTSEKLEPAHLQAAVEDQPQLSVGHIQKIPICGRDRHVTLTRACVVVVGVR